MKAEFGNILADFAFEAMRRQLLHAGRPAYMEQPEDLGTAGVQTVAFAQIDFGSANVKPTRLLMRTPGPLHPEMYEGRPSLDQGGVYNGPLPKKVGQPLIGKEKGAYKTASAAAWPDGLSKWVASQIFLSFHRTIEQGERKGNAEEEKNAEQEKTEDEDSSNPWWPPVRGGEGPARSCRWKGLEVPFHDGGCLLSPGRWDREKRRFPNSARWQHLRRDLVDIVVKACGGEAKLERECFAMATGEKGCRLVKDEELLGKLVEKMKEAAPTFQTKAGDGDFEFLREAEAGLPLGVKHQLPRTPNSFEKQTKWNLQNDPSVEGALMKDNYSSAKEHKEHVKRHLEEEVREGLVVKMREEDFIEKYGKERAVAALAVLVEDEVTGKKRIIHDGSHEILVNNRIRSKDKLRMPGGREKRALLGQFKSRRETVFLTHR